MIEWPDDLVRDIAARRCVLFLGAGVSKNAANEKNEHPKDWKEFLYHLAGRVRREVERKEVVACIEEGDLLTACELARKYLKPDGFKSELLKEYAEKGYRPSPIHDHLCLIDARFVLTTNIDKLYENRANQMQYNTVLVKHYYDDDVADVFRRDQRVVIKAHGTIDRVEKAIFTRSQYAIARRDYPRFYKIMRALFLTHTHVFIGASLRDPDIQMLLEDHAFQYPDSRPHYIIMPEGSVREGTLRVMEETMNLRALLYDPHDNHKELADSIERLVPLVYAAREELKLTTNW